MAVTGVYRELEEPAHTDFDLEAAPAIEAVLSSYPRFLPIHKV